jgi:hypothetical protein
MALRKLVSRPLPDLPEARASPRAAIEQAIAASPLAPACTFWESFRALKDWWPILLPVLLWVFWRNYNRERARVLAGADET